MASFTDADLTAQQISGDVESQIVLGQQPGFTIDADVVAIVFRPQSGHFGCMRSHPCGGVQKFGLKIDVLGLEPRCIGIGDVGRHELLPRAQQIQILFELACQGSSMDVFACKPRTTGNCVLQQ